jgi:hypothetical protein
VSLSYFITKNCINQALGCLHCLIFLSSICWGKWYGSLSICYVLFWFINVQ